MRTASLYLSIAAAVAVVARGAYLLFRHLSGDLRGHYDALGVFMNYLVHFGLVALVGMVFGIVGKTRAGIVGVAAYVLFATLIYLID